MRWNRRGDDPAMRFDRHVLYLLWHRIIDARRRAQPPAGGRRASRKRNGR